MPQGKHTQEPWVISLAAINTNVIEIVAGRFRIAELNAMGVRLDNDMLFANANLIVSAPKMLEALREAHELLRAYVEELELPEMCAMAEGRDTAEAAIAKAEGVLNHV